LQRRGQSGGSGGAEARESERVLIWGTHAVEAALANPAREILAVSLTENAEQRLAPVLARRGLEPERTSPRDLERRIGPDAVHQGVLLEVRPLPISTLDELAASDQTGRAPLIVVLDQVTDPHNVGAILRSCAVFGVRGLVMTSRHSPPLSGTLAKAASGGLEHVRIALVGNLAQALADLGDLGVERIGLDGEGEHRLEEITPSGPVALVLGAEGRGLRRLTREHCDRLARITTPGALSSLNVSNAAAVALHTLALALWRA
jgi:23S rRNA (guanosine2251-2'-O)-methyltransferase